MEKFELRLTGKQSIQGQPSHGDIYNIMNVQSDILGTGEEIVPDNANWIGTIL